MLIFVVASRFAILAVMLRAVSGHTHDSYVDPVLTTCSNVCYSDLGCFGTEAPFFSQYRPLNFLPQDPSKINTRFLLYTRKNPTTYHMLNAKDLRNFHTSHFNGDHPTKIISHGYLENGFVAWMKDMGTELLKAGDFNVILVDWGGGSGLPYTQATANTRVVGAEIAKLIKFLQQNAHIRSEDVHIIGHSLGAHIAGYAGERIRNTGRITGLDPADPFFQYTDTAVRLDPSDAQFVDILHTDGESILKLGFGMKQSCGHVDYFPNSGENQPGCDKDPVTTFITESTLYNGAKQFVACNHLRAIDYFTESINSACPFQGYQCSSYEDFKSGKCMPCSGNRCGRMGYHADQVKPTGRTTHVKYFLKTGASKPFCRYHYDVRISLASNSPEWRGMMYANIYGSYGNTGNQQLTDDYIDIRPGTTYGFVLISTHDIGHVNRVDVQWKHSASVLNPLQWNPFNLRHPTLSVSSVSVVNGGSRQQTRFCYNGNIENQKTVTMRTAC